MVRYVLAGTIAFSLLLSSVPLYAVAATDTAGQTRVLQGIPAIARAFASAVPGVKWQDFANVLAGICAVETKCDPTEKNYTSKGAYSQYQGLFQMNDYEVAKAETYLKQILPQMQAAAASSPEQQQAYDFVKKAIDAAQSCSSPSCDRRYLPEYGVILGAAKHIQLATQLQARYPGDPLHQAAGDITAQFSGIAEGQIRAGQWNAAVTGTPGDATTELGALSLNKVNGGTTLAGAIEAAGAQYGSRMQAMMTLMSQVTNGLTTVPNTIQPFTPPAYQPGPGPMLNVPYSGVAALMETGYMTPALAPAYPSTGPPSTTNIGTPLSPTGASVSNPLAGASNASAIIIVQPANVPRGYNIVVSWASVGMSNCQVSQGGAQIASANSGSQSVSTVSLQSGTVTFVLSCTDQSGQSTQQPASATIY